MFEVLTNEQIEQRIQEAKDCIAELNSMPIKDYEMIELLGEAVKDAEANLAKRREGK